MLFHGTRVLLVVPLVGALVVLVLGIVGISQTSHEGEVDLAYHGSSSAQDEWGMPPSNLVCWTPNHFASTHSAYVHSVCQVHLYNIIKDLHNKTNQEHGESANAEPEDNTDDATSAEEHDARKGRKLRPITYAAVDAAVACVCFFIVLNISAALTSHGNMLHHMRRHGSSALTDVLDKLTASRCLAISMLLLHIVAAFVWLFLAISTPHAKQLSSSSGEHSDKEVGSHDGDNGNIPGLQTGVFMCDVDILNLGSTNSYTLQCHYSIGMVNGGGVEMAAAGGEIQEYGIVHAAVGVHLLLCCCMVVFTLLHLAYMFILGPRSSRNDVRTLVLQMAAPSNIVDRVDSAMFGLTDFSLVVLLVTSCAFEQNRDDKGLLEECKEDREDENNMAMEQKDNAV